MILGLRLEADERSDPPYKGPGKSERETNNDKWRATVD